jgi:hypothetical protein
VYKNIGNKLNLKEWIWNRFKLTWCDSKKKNTIWKQLVSIWMELDTGLFWFETCLFWFETWITIWKQTDTTKMLNFSTPS